MLTTVLVNFNHARFLRQSLESILAQTRPSEELIVIDDDSTDDSVEIISSLLPRHPNARLFRNPKNQGCVANMNDGLKLAQGDIIHFAAADDVFYADFYRTAIALMDEHPQAGLFSCRSDVIDANGRMISAPLPRAGLPIWEPGFISPAEAARTLMRDDGWFMGNASVFRRAHVAAAGGFRPELNAFSDGYMSRILALKHGSCYSPEVLTAWRKLEAGFSTTLNISLEQSLAFLSTVEKQMRADADVLPVGYAARWKGRQIYEVRRRILARGRGAGKERQGIIRSGIEGIARKIETFRLLLRWCPWDLLPSVRLYLANMAGAGQR